MKTNVKTTGIDLTESLSDYVDEKLGHIEKFLDPKDESIICDVEIGMSTKHHQNGDIFVAEINLHTAGNNFYSKAEKEDLYLAINEAKEQISKEVVSAKNKERTSIRKGAGIIKRLLRRSDS
jgi:ribosomal subunit interface protein